MYLEERPIVPKLQNMDSSDREDPQQSTSKNEINSKNLEVDSGEGTSLEVGSLESDTGKKKSIPWFPPTVLVSEQKEETQSTPEIIVLDKIEGEIVEKGPERKANRKNWHKANGEATSLGVRIMESGNPRFPPMRKLPIRPDSSDRKRRTVPWFPLNSWINIADTPQSTAENEEEKKRKSVESPINIPLRTKRNEDSRVVDQRNPQAEPQPVPDFIVLDEKEEERNLESCRLFNEENSRKLQRKSCLDAQTLEKGKMPRFMQKEKTQPATNRDEIGGENRETSELSSEDRIEECIQNVICRNTTVLLSSKVIRNGPEREKRKEKSQAVVQRNHQTKTQPTPDIIVLDKIREKALRNGPKRKEDSQAVERRNPQAEPQPEDDIIVLDKIGEEIVENGHGRKEDSQSLGQINSQAEPQPDEDIIVLDQIEETNLESCRLNKKKSRKLERKSCLGVQILENEKMTSSMQNEKTQPAAVMDEIVGENLESCGLFNETNSRNLEEESFLGVEIVENETMPCLPQLLFFSMRDGTAQPATDINEILGENLEICGLSSEEPIENCIQDVINRDIECPRSNNDTKMMEESSKSCENPDNQKGQQIQRPEWVPPKRHQTRHLLSNRRTTAVRGIEEQPLHNSNINTTAMDQTNEQVGIKVPKEEIVEEEEEPYKESMLEQMIRHPPPVWHERRKRRSESPLQLDERTAALRESWLRKPQPSSSTSHIDNGLNTPGSSSSSSSSGKPKYGPRRSWIPKPPPNKPNEDLVAEDSILANLGPSLLRPDYPNMYVEKEVKEEPIEEEQETPTIELKPEPIDESEEASSSAAPAQDSPREVREMQVEELINETYQNTAVNATLKAQLKAQSEKLAALEFENRSLTHRNEQLTEKLKFCSNLAIKIAKERDEAEARIPPEKKPDYSVLYTKLRSGRRKDRLDYVLESIKRVCGSSASEEELVNERDAVIRDLYEMLKTDGS